MELKNAKVLVTGGSLGIGKATTKKLVDAGSKVVMTGRDQGRIEAAATVTGGIPLVFDQSEINNIPSKVEEVVKLLGGDIDILINNAGTGIMAPIDEINAEQFHETFSTNVVGLALLTKEVVKIMKVKKSGTIVNLGSTASLKGFPNGTVYSASKFAVRAMTQCWQAELRKFNIRVSLVNPSEVTTAFNNPKRIEREATNNKLDSDDIADTILSVIKMDDKGFIPEVTVWATNPF